jgi:drug/metabolite transporter (DMT)-like permease
MDHHYSIPERVQGYLLLTASLGFQISSAFFGKMASLHLQSMSVRHILTNEYYCLGLVSLGLQAIVWPLALRHFSLTKAYLFMSQTFIGVLLLSRFVFNETITAANIAGTVAVGFGVVMVMRDK